MTPFSQIDDMFLADISDDTFLDFNLEDREKIIAKLRNKAISRFKACKIDLYDKDDILKQFNQILSDEVQLIIATIMKKYWLSDKIYNLSLIKQRMTTKDWKLNSQAEHLSRLTVLKNDLDKEISQMMINYTFYAYTVE